MSATLRTLYPPNPVTARAQSTKLSSDAKGTTLSYAAGRTAIIRPLPDGTNKKTAIAYAEHSQPTTVARISPSGFYCASADAGGTVRIWDLVGTEQILKSEVKVVAGRLNDLSWDGENQRMIAVGHGKEFFGRAFLVDTGSSAGEISGHSKPINAVALKPQRPFRAVTASDDNTLVFYHGVPFKYNKTISTHSRFVQDVRYAPNGERFVSAGSDGKVFVYDGKTGDVLFELQESGGGGGGGATSNAHSGSIFAVDFAPDSNRIVTASADGFVKVWDLNTKAVLGSWDLNGKNDLGGVGVDKSVDQQVGVTWLGGDSDGFASISLGGEINIVKGVSSPSGTKVTKLHGPCASITSLAQGAKPGTLYAGTFDGRVLSYDASGQATLVQGPRHASSVSALASASSSTLSIGIDETLRLIGTDGAFTSSVSAGTTGYPKYLAIGTSTSSSSSFGPVFVGTPSGIDIFPSLPSSTTKSHFARTYDITSLAAAPGAQWVAVGASDGKVYLHTYKEAAGLTEAKQLVRQTTISALAFSGDGALLAVGEGNGKIAVYNTSDWSVKTSAWAFHTARIQSIQFSPDNSHAISGSLDSNVFVWSVAKPSKKIQISKAHPNGVTALSWLDNDSFASAGADSCIKLWDVKKHE